MTDTNTNTPTNYLTMDGNVYCREFKIHDEATVTDLHNAYTGEFNKSDLTEYFDPFLDISHAPQCTGDYLEHLVGLQETGEEMGADLVALTHSANFGNADDKKEARDELRHLFLLWSGEPEPMEWKTPAELFADEMRAVAESARRFLAEMRTKELDGQRKALTAFLATLPAREKLTGFRAVYDIKQTEARNFA